MNQDNTSKQTTLSALQNEGKRDVAEVEIDWSNIGFSYFKTDYNLRCEYHDGKWGEVETSSDETIPLHMAATALHYGQDGFEGLKAFRGPDGKVRVFRAEDNARRLQSTCEALLMPKVPVDMFCTMVERAIRLNERFIPPYESGASLYVRPIIIGTTPHVGVRPSSEYMFIVFVTPAGPYMRGGFSSHPFVIARGYDRSAPLGTGKYKVGGNYAASLRANKIAHDSGYASEIYLDAKEKKYIDECGSANFFGIKDNTYVTPLSSSILPSITNDSLMQIARDLGMNVEHRQIADDELATFQEAGACGTAAVITPISYIDDPDKEVRYDFGEQPGPVSTRLYNMLRGIQYGTEPDIHGWTRVVNF